VSLCRLRGHDCLKVCDLDGDLFSPRGHLMRKLPASQDGGNVKATIRQGTQMDLDDLLNLAAITLSIFVFHVWPTYLL
jgi:hypothetical protein